LTVRAAALALATAAALLAGCASGPSSGPRSGRDGPEANPPAGLAEVPDAVPRIEPLRTGGPNKPYRVLGRSYTPMTEDLPLQESGLASWYGRKFHGQPTSNGEIYDMYAMTAAHKTMPLPSYARVRNPANGREIIVRVNDRGPFSDGRVIDLSYTAALKLGVLRGVAPVEVQRLTFDDIRNGRWREAGSKAARDAERLRRQTDLDALVLELSAP
jgi:rare lipoprotein A